MLLEARSAPIECRDEEPEPEAEGLLAMLLLVSVVMVLHVVEVGSVSWTATRDQSRRLLLSIELKDCCFWIRRRCSSRSTRAATASRSP